MNYTQHITKPRKEAAQEYIGIIKRFIKSKYYAQERIDCQFDLYYHDVTNPQKVKHQQKVLPLIPMAYTQLLVVLLASPDLTFQDLPMYIPRGLYDAIIKALYFPRYEHVHNLSRHPRRSPSVAVEMTTLQQDAREIAGEDIYTFGLPPEPTGYFHEIFIHCECRKLRINIMRVEHDPTRIAYHTYTDIDASKIQELLGVKDFRGIESTWKDIYKNLPSFEQTDIFWLIHWLDANSLKYTYKCEFDTDD